jgi:iron complex transport system substrate-binding protein
LSNIVKLTEPKIRVDGTSKEIHQQIEAILEKSLSVYKVNIEKLKNLDPDFIVTQAHCEVCAVSFSHVENITKEHLGSKTKIISLQPNTLKEVFDDLERVAKNLKIESSKTNKLINGLKKRIHNVKITSSKLNKPKILCIEWSEPLMAAGNWIPEMIEIAGGKDILGKKGSDSHWIKFENIIESDPDFIIFIPCGFNLKQTKKDVETLIKGNNKWKNLRAFKNKNFYITDGNQYFNRPGPRLVESIEILCEIIHPNNFNFGHKNSAWINFFDTN